MSGSGSVEDVTSIPRVSTRNRLSKKAEKRKANKEQMDYNQIKGIVNQQQQQPAYLDESPFVSFCSVYNRWKEVMRASKSKMTTQRSEAELAEIIELSRLHEKYVLDSFQRLQATQVPDQITPQRMDSCTANSNNLVALAQTKMAEVDMEPWNEEAEQARLRSMLHVNYAKSLYSLKPSEMPDTTSVHSHSSSLPEKRAIAVAELATKEAELKSLKEQRGERARLQAEMDRLDRERDITIKRAEVAALDQLLGQNSHTEAKETVNLNPDATPYVPQAVMLQAIRESLDYSRLPACEPLRFGGDPLEFPKWRRSFEALIEHRRIRPSDKLALLEKYLKGEAAESVSGMFYRSDEQAYEDAWKVLNERFGHPSLILNAFRSKLSGWPKINPKDYTGIQKFADYLIALDHAIPHVEGLKILNDQEENKKLLKKLPDWLVTRWGSTVADHDTKNQSYPDFHIFASFMATQARMATRPICSLMALKENESSNNPPPRRITTFHTTTMENKPSPQPKQKGCPFCKTDSNHYLPTCHLFLSKGLKDRRAFIKDQKRCFRCLRTGHGAKACTNPHKCNKCQGKHPTALHDDDFISKKETTTAKTYRLHCEDDPNGTLSTTSLTLPVWISSEENPNEERLVYALIDSQSDTTFIDSSLIAQLRIQAKEKTRLKVQTLVGDHKGMVCERVSNLRVRGYNGQILVNLPHAYTIEHVPLQPNSIATPDTVKEWNHLKEIADQLPPKLNIEAGILIGFDCSHAFLPRECVSGADTEPFAIKTDLGWGVIGGTASTTRLVTSQCNRICTRELPLSNPADALRILESDFKDGPGGKAVSQEDLKFLETMENSMKRTSIGRYQLPLPFRNDEPPSLPSNKGIAIKRLNNLKRKLESNKELHEEYKNFMEATIADSHAEKVETDSTIKGREWYIPHHGVLHPQKRKLRVVFDCSAKTGNTCLNDYLLTGPNLIANLVGILCRFRQHNIAITCDIEKMFYQFEVPPEHRDYLRFLWWEQGDLTKEPAIFRMKVHLFGAASSPGCANYALKRLGQDNKKIYPLGSKFIEENFYVDDGLISVPDVTTAVQIIREATAVCAKGKIRLHKFASNSKMVLKGLQKTELAEGFKSLNLNDEETTIQRTLGMQWSTEKDTIHFSFSSSPKPTTRRGVLSTVASLYDPLGLVAPFIMIGKRILQATCQRGSRWDEEMPSELLIQWQRWVQELTSLHRLCIPRCYYPANFIPVEFQLHHFADASQKGYGMCSYLRTKCVNGKIHCALVAAKARVAPSKSVSIPRLELTAALVAAEIGHTVRDSLTLQITKEYFWSDSKVVLGYINNDAKKFHVFVANRVSKIQELTKPSQWHHIASEKNPADHCSRGLHVSELISSNWLTGPAFLWKDGLQLPEQLSSSLQLGDPEIKTVTSLKTTLSPRCDLDSRLSHISQWSNVIRSVSRIRNLKDKGNSRDVHQSVKELKETERSIIRCVQAQFFTKEITSLDKNQPLPAASPIKHAEPFLQDGLLRVGGRLTNSQLSMDEKHPIILPKDAHVTKLLIKHHHARVQHQGRGITWNELRSQGYWITSGSREVANVIKNCVTCRKLRGSVLEQQMAPLPKTRVQPSPPFTYAGMDAFGPFTVRNGLKETKRYGLIFTCFSSRAIHIELLDDLSTDSFINSLRCFLAIRGSVTELYCDQGTNFIGAANEFETAMKGKVQQFLAHEKQCQFIFNVPHSSHAGGVWERQIRTIKSIMNTTLSLSANRLDDSSLRTLFYETMSIINCRPITAIQQGEPTAPMPLTPNHILTMKPRTPLPPPGTFVKEDVYLRKRWRRVQFLCEQFWSRWRKEYLMNLSLRQKWGNRRRNLKVGDIVLVAESSPRNQWPLGRVINVSRGDDSLVRSVKIYIATKDLDAKGKRSSRPTILDRPVQKLVSLLTLEEQ